MFPRIPHKEEAIEGLERTEAYEESHRRFERLPYRGLLKAFQDLGIQGDALEVGAGTGGLAAILAGEHPGLRITALDLSRDMLQRAEERMRREGLEERVRLRCGDVRDASFLKELGLFDAVYSAFSLHHWQDPFSSIRNLWGAVKPGGVLCIYDLKRVPWLYALPGKGGFMASIRASYRPSELAGLFREAGIPRFRIGTRFPFFMQIALAVKDH